MIAELSKFYPFALAILVVCSAVGCRRGNDTSTSQPSNASVSTDNAPQATGAGGEASTPSTGSAVTDSPDPDVSASPADLMQPGQTANAGSEADPKPGLALPENAPTEASDEPIPGSQWNRGPSPEEIATKAFEPPPGATSLSKDGRLWIDPKKKRVYIDGYVTMKRGPLEMFACPAGTKEHESIVAALSRSRDAHAALLAVEASPGTPVRFRPEFVPPTGQVIRVWVCWYDSDGKFQTVDAREWIHDLDTGKAMSAEWVFAGSGFWQDPEDNREYYEADAGDMICVSNFSSAMLDVAMSSSADADALRFEPFEAKIPELETPVRLVLVPVPNPSDDADPKAQTPDKILPTADDVPRSKEGQDFTERSAAS